MTPELKTACELVFQQHKVSGHAIRWDKDAFRGRISIGLSEMAKETLVKKNILLFPAKPKKVITQLNPDVATASSFEEAEKIIETKIPDLTAPAYDAETYITNHVFGFAATPPITHKKQPIARKYKVAREDTWWLRPTYLYFVWPACGIVGGILTSMFMNFVYMMLFSGK